MMVLGSPSSTRDCNASIYFFGFENNNNRQMEQHHFLRRICDDSGMMNGDATASAGAPSATIAPREGGGLYER